MNGLERSVRLGGNVASRQAAKRSRTATLSGLRRRENALAYAFLGPSLVLFAVFFFYPMIDSVYLSLHSTDPTGKVAGFVGLDNFKFLTQDARFLKGLQVTVAFALLTVPTGIALALVLAALTSGKGRGLRAFRFVFSMPVVLSVGSSSVIWMFLFHPTLGMLNYILSLLHLAPVPWLVSPKWALVSVSMMTVWMNLGFLYIVLLSGIKGIPEELLESARIDGAGPFRSFVRILLPLLSPSLFFVTVISVIGAFQSFGQVNILTRGGPMDSTNVLVFSIYQEAFVNYRFGTGSAQALVLFAVILLLTYVQFKWVEKRVHYQ